MSDDVKDLEEAYSDSKQAQREALSLNPVTEVQNALFRFYTHRLDKLQKDIEFEQELKASILARLPEAQFNELISILNTVQANTNYGVEKVLLPFLPKDGENVPLLDGGKKQDKKKDSDEQLFDESNKDTLQAINELNKAVTLIAKTMKSKEAEEIKQALE